MSKKNPRVEAIEVGITEIKKLDVYPLSLAAEKKVLALYKEVKDFMDQLCEEEYEGGYGDIPVPVMIDKIVEVISMNMETVLSSVTKDEDIVELLDEIDNCQAIDLATLMYKQNFEEPKKKMVTVIPQKEAPKKKAKKKVTPKK